MAFKPFDDLSPETADGVLTVLSMIVRIDKNRAHERYPSKRLNYLAQRFKVLSDSSVFAAIFHTFKDHVEEVHAMLSKLECEGSDDRFVAQKELETWSRIFAKVNLLAIVAASEHIKLTDESRYKLENRFTQTFEKLGGKFFYTLDEAEFENTYQREIWNTDIFRVPSL